MITFLWESIVKCQIVLFVSIGFQQFLRVVFSSFKRIVFMFVKQLKMIQSYFTPNRRGMIFSYPVHRQAKLLEINFSLSLLRLNKIFVWPTEKAANSSAVVRIGMDNKTLNLRSNHRNLLPSMKQDCSTTWDTREHRQTFLSLE